MRKYQRGVTLLETILVVAILGGVLAYSGTLLMKSVKINQLEKAAEKIVQLQKVIKEYSTTVYLSKDGAASVPNPLLISSSIADEVMRDDLLWLKSNNCKIPGVISDDVDRTYLTCEYNPNAIDLEYISTNFEFVEYKNASYIDAKRFATTATSLYVGQTKNAEGFLSIVSRIDDVKNEDGYRLSSERVSLGLFRKAGGIYTLEPSKPLIKLSDFVGNDVSIISDYVRDVDQGGYYPGFYINSFYNEEISLKRDGSIPLQKERRLCWDSERGTIESCLSSITEENGGKHYNYIVAENSGFIYGQDKKKTPIELSRKTFINNRNVNVPYLNCPSRLKNKIEVIPTSFSSGSEADTDFSDPARLISTGTEGADGSHAFITGLSLQYSQDDTNKRWEVTGTIAIDSAYAMDNSSNVGSPLVRNPEGVSFAVLQWCEEI